MDTVSRATKELREINTTNISQEFLEKLPEMEVEEEDMLDLLSEIKENSRLACQCYLDESLDGLVAEIPYARMFDAKMTTLADCVHVPIPVKLVLPMNHTQEWTSLECRITP
eukprot:m.28014 g.28014  ORF g.28014 m.28014 type:complete len:112 (+) comp13512_c0_seq2:153-488(+)